jgi:hypothetical protein
MKICTVVYQVSAFFGWVQECICTYSSVPVQLKVAPMVMLFWQPEQLSKLPDYKKNTYFCGMLFI